MSAADAAGRPRASAEAGDRAAPDAPPGMSGGERVRSCAIADTDGRACGRPVDPGTPLDLCRAPPARGARLGRPRHRRHRPAAVAVPRVRLGRRRPLSVGLDLRRVRVAGRRGARRRARPAQGRGRLLHPLARPDQDRHVDQSAHAARGPAARRGARVRARRAIARAAAAPAVRRPPLTPAPSGSRCTTRCSRTSPSSRPGSTIRGRSTSAGCCAAWRSAARDPSGASAATRDGRSRHVTGTVRTGSAAACAPPSGRCRAATWAPRTAGTRPAGGTGSSSYGPSGGGPIQGSRRAFMRSMKPA